MSDKYCPAGKIKCEHFKTTYGFSDRVCEVLMVSIQNFEQCPSPSRQQPVEKIENAKCNSECQDNCEKCEFPDIAMRVDRAYSRGRSDALKEAVEEIKERLKYYEIGSLGNKIINGDLKVIESLAKK